MREKIRLVTLGPYPMDASRIAGGVQAAYMYLLKGLSQNPQLDVHVLTYRPGAYTGPDRYEQNNLTVHLLPVYPRFERLRNYRMYQSIINYRLSQIQPDLIHAQESGSNALVALRSGFPTVVTVHGIQWEDGKHYSSLNKRIRVLYDSLVTERYIMRHLRYLIACSRYVTSYFKDVLRPDIDVYYLMNAIDDCFFNLVKRPIGQVILFAGRVIPRKRVMDLVHAFALVLKQVPSAQLHIAGETQTEPEYVESILRWVHHSHIEEHVHFLGHLSQESILQEFAGCSLLALPSAQETTPLVIAQAMAASTPVIATRVGGVQEMVGEDGSRGSLLDVGDIDGMAAAMVRLLQNPDLQAKMGQCSREFALENNHTESVARRTCDVYRNIVSKDQTALV